MTAWGAAQRLLTPLGRILTLSSWELQNSHSSFPSTCPQPWRQAQKTARWHAPSVEQTCRSPARDWHWRACKKPPAYETALASVFIIYFNLLRADPNIWFLSAMYTEPSSVCKQLQNTVEIANRRFLGFPCTSWHTRWHTSLKNHQYIWTHLFF